MSDFQYESSAATAEAEIPNEGWATENFEADRPMDSPMRIPRYPWEVTPGFLPDPSGLVAPLANVLIITAPLKRAKEATQEYVERIKKDLPGEVRNSFVQGAGMFDFPAPPNLDDHLS